MSKLVAVPIIPALYVMCASSLIAATESVCERSLLSCSLSLSLPACHGTHRGTANETVPQQEPAGGERITERLRSSVWAELCSYARTCREDGVSLVNAAP